jgi:multiple sugar transport system permease protein
MVPAIVFVVGVVAFPMSLAFFLSVSQAQLGETPTFTGLGNYQYLLRQGIYREALLNTAVYSGVSLIMKALLGLGMALALARPFPGRRLVYALLFVPFIFPISMGTVSWYYLLSNVHGAFNYALVELGLVHHSIAWLGWGPLPMLSLITVNVWHGTALFGVLLLAGLRSVPSEMLDSARVDGARAVQRFLYMQLPRLRAPLALAAMLSLMGTFGDFAVVFLLTAGGPYNETQIVSTFAFQVALRDGDLGIGTAAAISLLPVYVVGLAYLLRVLESR